MLRVIIVNLKGGLGNQMFQYALGYTLSKIKKVPMYFDLRLMEEHKINPSPRNVPRDFDLDVFGIEKDIVSKKDLSNIFENFEGKKPFIIDTLQAKKSGVKLSSTKLSLLRFIKQNKELMASKL